MQKNMRHASIQTTGIYLHAEDDLRHAETVLPHSQRQRKAIRRIAEPSNPQTFREDVTAGKPGLSHVLARRGLCGWIQDGPPRSCPSNQTREAAKIPSL